MNPFKLLYDFIINKIMEEHRRKLKEAEKIIMAKSSGSPRVSKFEYRLKCLNMNRTEREISQQTKANMRKWDWLKKLT